MSRLAKALQAAAGNAGGGASGGWDLANAVWNGPTTFSVRSQETVPKGVFFKPDGLAMYVVGYNINQYSLSAAWDVTTASYVQNFSVAAQETAPQGVFFKPDGTVMYVCGDTSNIHQYFLSTAWDITTASYVQSFSTAAQGTFPTGVFFKPDGLVMYAAGASALHGVIQYSLSTAWDLSTASYVQELSVVAQESDPQDVFFAPDGLVMYIIGYAGDDVNQYSLSTAWDISTASYVQNFYVGTQELTPTGCFFKPDGTGMYVIGQTSDNVNQYSLGTAWDINTIPNTQTFSVAAQELNPTGCFFKPDGTQMYVVGASGDDVNQYSLGTAWDVSTASYVQNFSVASEDPVPQAIFFKPDGLQMYTVGGSGFEINQYSLGTAWDVSTASYVQNFSVAAQEIAPQGVFFKPDGTQMYVVGTSGDDVNQYSLSAAWDIATSIYLQNFSVSAQETAPRGVFFKPDGLQMYVVGSTGRAVNQYSLGTAWDVSTASYVQNFSVAAQETAPQGVFFKPDGTVMYIAGSNGDSVYQYQL